MIWPHWLVQINSMNMSMPSNYLVNGKRNTVDSAGSRNCFPDDLVPWHKIIYHPPANRPHEAWILSTVMRTSCDGSESFSPIETTSIVGKEAKLVSSRILSSWAVVSFMIVCLYRNDILLVIIEGLDGWRQRLNQSYICSFPRLVFQCCRTIGVQSQ